MALRCLLVFCFRELLTEFRRDVESFAANVERNEVKVESPEAKVEIPHGNVERISEKVEPVNLLANSREKVEQNEVKVTFRSKSRSFLCKCRTNPRKSRMRNYISEFLR